MRNCVLRVVREEITMHHYKVDQSGRGVSIVQHFDSLAELDAAEPVHKADYQNMICRERPRTNSEKWWGYGVLSGGWDHARELILEGHPEARIRGHMFLDRLDFPPTRMRTVRRVRRRGDDGDEVDMQQVWSGNLDRAWEYMQREGGSQSLNNNNVVVAIDTAMLGHQHSDDLFWNVSTGIAVIDALCRSGRNVEVIAVAHARDIHKPRHWLTSITLKPATAPLNLDLMYGTTLGGFHRGFMFKSRTMSPDYRTPTGMGMSVHARARSPFWPPNWPVVYITGCTTEDRARQKISDLVKKFDDNDLAVDTFN